MTEQPLALWAEITIAVLVLLGAVIALIGSLGLLRLKDYYERVHAPSMIATMGCWSIMHATILFFSLQGHGFAAYPLLIALFVAITVPPRGTERTGQREPDGFQTCGLTGESLLKI